MHGFAALCPAPDGATSEGRPAQASTRSWPSLPRMRGPRAVTLDGLAHRDREPPVVAQRDRHVKHHPRLDRDVHAPVEAQDVPPRPSPVRTRCPCCSPSACGTPRCIRRRRSPPAPPRAPRRRSVRDAACPPPPRTPPGHTSYQSRALAGHAADRHGPERRGMVSVVAGRGLQHHDVAVADSPPPPRRMREARPRAGDDERLHADVLRARLDRGMHDLGRDVVLGRSRAHRGQARPSCRRRWRAPRREARQAHGGSSPGVAIRRCRCRPRAARAVSAAGRTGLR